MGYSRPQETQLSTLTSAPGTAVTGPGSKIYIQVFPYSWDPSLLFSTWKVMRITTEVGDCLYASHGLKTELTFQAWMVFTLVQLKGNLQNKYSKALTAFLALVTMLVSALWKCWTWLLPSLLKYSTRTRTRFVCHAEREKAISFHTQKHIRHLQGIQLHRAGGSHSSQWTQLLTWVNVRCLLVVRERPQQRVPYRSDNQKALETRGRHKFWGRMDAVDL